MSAQIRDPVCPREADRMELDEIIAGFFESDAHPVRASVRLSRRRVPNPSRDVRRIS
jgi:hypothetical protein